MAQVTRRGNVFVTQCCTHIEIWPQWAVVCSVFWKHCRAVCWWLALVCRWQFSCHCLLFIKWNHPSEKAMSESIRGRESLTVMWRSCCETCRWGCQASHFMLRNSWALSGQLAVFQDCNAWPGRAHPLTFFDSQDELASYSGTVNVEKALGFILALLCCLALAWNHAQT